MFCENNFKLKVMFVYIFRKNNFTIIVKSCIKRSVKIYIENKVVFVCFLEDIFYCNIKIIFKGV